MDAILQFQIGSVNGDTVCFDIPILADDRAENQQSFSVNLRLEDLNAQLVGNAFVTVIIEDDDGKM
jgi:hypothetical protein